MMHTHRDSTSWDFDESSGGGRIKKKDRIILFD